MFFEIGVLKNVSNFREKQQRWSLDFNLGCINSKASNMNCFEQSDNSFQMKDLVTV